MNKSKPRVFVGSSVEGLGVAYAVQQNLMHSAEVTVWDQGVFELSATSIESLTAALDSSDFGVFAMTPDDVAMMRGRKHSVVRDNVLFELGLFIGRLGRDRVFFLIPKGRDLHLATDLAGVTPGTYVTDRSDGSMQAATGPACHQIRLQIEKRGLLREPEAMPAATEAEAAPEPKSDWLLDFVRKNYAEAILKLDKKIADPQDEDLEHLKAWRLYAEYKLDPSRDHEMLYEVGRQTSSPKNLAMIAAFLRNLRYQGKAVDLLTECASKFPGDPEIAIALATSYKAVGRTQEALESLRLAAEDGPPELAVAFANNLFEQEAFDEALEAIAKAFARFPRNSEVRETYAKVADEKDEHATALYLLHELTQDDPLNTDYWVRFGNACFNLSLHDKAMNAYRKEDSIQEESKKESWVASNIGNLLSHKGLFEDARDWLNRAIKIAPKSEYAHKRLAETLSSSESERKEFDRHVLEGKRLVRERENPGTPTA
jgi:tetratricopeptide (TPR) repeat protein